MEQTEQNSIYYYRGDVMIYGVFCTFLGTMFTLGITTLGALNVFLVKKKIEGDLQCIFLGFVVGFVIMMVLDVALG